MWHEARKQEKKIRGMIVDHRKRSERRKEFYEKIKADPCRFIQLHGRKCKIHFEANIDVSDHIMPWQGEKDTLIDRFDVRAHLDYIPQPKKQEESESEKLTEEERQSNYERYRVLAQNEFLGINEENFLKQIQIEEQFGSSDKGIEGDKGKKKNSQATAAIGYDYGCDPTAPSTTVPFSQQILSIESSNSSSRYEEFAKDYSDDSDIDMDVTVDVKKVGTQQAHELNNYGKKYGMHSNDLFSFLTRDEDEKLTEKALKEQEADKILSGGRKSRRERRSQREKRIMGRPLNSPPSYAAKEKEKSPENEDEEDESERSSRESKSPSEEKITYITSFGGEEELQPHSKISIPFKKNTSKNLGNLRKNESFSEIVKRNADKLSHMNEFEKCRTSRRSRSSEYDKRKRRSRSTSRRRRFSRSGSRRGHRSRSRSRRRYYSRSRSREKRSYYRNRSSRSYSISPNRDRRCSRDRQRRRHYSSRRSSSYRRHDRHRSTSPEDRRSYRKRSPTPPKKRSSSRKKTPASRKPSVSHERKRSYSTSSSSSSSTTTSSSSSTNSKSSPEKKNKASIDRKEKDENLLSQRQPPPLPPPPPPSIPNVAKSKSKSPEREKRSSSKEAVLTVQQREIPLPIKRYYGRKRDDESSSSLSIDSDDDDDKNKKIGSNESSANDDAYKVIRSGEFKINMSKSTVGPSTSNPREKLKKKMQILLNKQYKADKKAETEKIERQMQQQQERDEELREAAIKMRRKRRELRHKYGGEDGNQDSRTNSDSDEYEAKRKRERRSSTSSSDSADRMRRRKSRSSSRYRNKRKISRSPVRHRRSRSRSDTGRRSRNYRR